MNHISVRSFGSFWFPVKIMRFWKLVGLTFHTIWTKHEQNMIQEYLNHLFVKNTWRKLFNNQEGRGPILDFSTTFENPFFLSLGLFLSKTHKNKIRKNEFKDNNDFGLNRSDH